jgi:hypothetical protein
MSVVIRHSYANSVAYKRTHRDSNIHTGQLAAGHRICDPLLTAVGVILLSYLL